MEYKQLFSNPLAAAGFSTANNQSDVIAKKGKCNFALYQQNSNSKSWEVIVFVYSGCVPHWAPFLFRNDSEKLEQFQRMATRIIRGQETKSYEDRLKQFHSIWEKKKEEYDKTLQIPEQVSHKRSQPIFSHSGVQDLEFSNEFKLQEGIFWLNIKRLILSVTVIWKGNQLWKELVAPLSMTMLE